jgi:Phage tail tube protein
MAQGSDVVIGHARGSVWNTAVSVNAANRGLLLNNWPLGTGLGPPVYSASLAGSGGRANAIRGLQKLNGEANSELRYTGLEHVLAMIMGQAGVPTVVATAAQQHVFQLAPGVDGLYDTIAVQKVGPQASPALPIYEYPSVKYGGFTLTLTADGLAMINFPLIASKCVPLTGQINATLAAVTYRTKVLNVFGTHIKWRAKVVPPTGDTALTDADRFYPSQMTITFTRNMDSDYVMDGTGVQPEPYATDFFSVEIAVTFPVYGTAALQANNTFLAAAFAEQAMKMDIVMTSPIDIPGTTPPTKYSHLLEFPNIMIADVQTPVEGPGAIPQNLQLVGLEAAVAPAGMTGLTRHFRWTAVSALATDALLNP